MTGEPSRSIGGFEVLGELGRGGYGRVFRVRDPALGIERALKVLDVGANPDALARFRREAETLARLGGDGVIPVHASGIERGRVWFVMDLAAGGTLRDRMRRQGGALPWREACTLGAKLARTLARLAAAGLVHRDVKPENVLLDDRGEPRLADFGLVRDLAERITESGVTIGTIPYMSPEQIDGRALDASSDVFALGVVLYELFTGARPFDSTSFFQQVRSIAAGPPLDAFPKDASPFLRMVVARALAFEKKDRPDAAELARALDALAEGKTYRETKNVETTRRASLAAAILTAALLVVVSGLALEVARRREGPAPVTTAAAPVPMAPRPAAADVRFRATDLCALLGRVLDADVLLDPLEGFVAERGRHPADEVAAVGSAADAWLGRWLKQKNASGDAPLPPWLRAESALRALGVPSRSTDLRLRIQTFVGGQFDARDRDDVAAIVSAACLFPEDRLLGKRAGLAFRPGGLPHDPGNRALAESLVKASPRSPWAHIAVALAAYNGQPKPARADLEASLDAHRDAQALAASDPEDRRDAGLYALASAARVLIQLDEDERALALLRLAVEGREPHGRLYRFFALAQFRRRGRSEAQVLEVLRQGVEACRAVSSDAGHLQDIIRHIEQDGIRKHMDELRALEDPPPQ